MFKTIVVGNDGSTQGERAMAQARTLAQESGARLIVVHVTELVGGKGGVYPLDIDEPETRHRIKAAVAAMQQDGVSASFVNETTQLGGPARVLVTVAGTEDADLIVVGAHGHSVFNQLVLGSVPLRLLHVSPCPVLVIPPERHES